MKLYRSQQAQKTTAQRITFANAIRADTDRTNIQILCDARVRPRQPQLISSVRGGVSGGSLRGKTGGDCQNVRDLCECAHRVRCDGFTCYGTARERSVDSAFATIVYTTLKHTHTHTP